MINNSATDARIDNFMTILKNNSQNSYSRDSLRNLLEIKEIKEDHYLTQLTIQSDRIIMYVSILFVLVGLIGYTTFVNKITEINTNTQDKISRQEEKHAVHNTEFKNLKVQNFDVLSTVLDLSSAFFIEKGLNSESIKQRLIAVFYLVSAIEITEDAKRKEAFIERCINLLGITHQQLIMTLADQATFQKFIDSVDFEVNIKVLDEIVRMKNARIIDFTMEIRSIFRKLEIQVKNRKNAEKNTSENNPPKS